MKLELDIEKHMKLIVIGLMIPAALILLGVTTIGDFEIKDIYGIIGLGASALLFINYFVPKAEFEEMQKAYDEKEEQSITSYENKIGKGELDELSGNLKHNR